MRWHILTAFMLLCGLPASHAQWGVRATVLHFETLTPRGTFSFLGGLDHDITDRTAMGLDFTIGVDLFGTDASEQTEYDGYTVDYILTQRSMGVTYRSMYFFSDNDGGAAFYAGPFVGFRQVSYEVEPTTYSYYSYDEPGWSRRETGSTTMFPLGLRMGFRGPLDGFSGDIYVGFGFLAGGSDPVKAPYLDSKDRISRTILQAGYTMGIGW